MQKYLFGLGLLCAVSTTQALTQKDVKQLVECTANTNQLIDVNEKNLKKIGWKKQEQGNMFMEVFVSPQPIKFFGYPTQKIAIVPGGVVGIYEPKMLDIFQQKFNIPRDTIFNLPHFRGSKQVYKGNPKFAGFKRMLNLSDLVNENEGTRDILLGCSYE